MMTQLEKNVANYYLLFFYGCAEFRQMNLMIRR